MARVQEKITFPVQPANSFKLVLPGRPNGVCTNKEGTLCAVGGRNLLKVFAVEEKGFAEKINLIVGPKKLNYALTDVQWHPIEDNYVASSAGNGVVLLWDLNKVGNESKQDHVFHHHYRFVNKLCFHPSDPALLMSCSQDGNMHLLDIRQKKLVETFRGKSDGIADIQFHPTDKGIFCAACESGNVQLWDMRKPEHHYNQFTAHRGPVFTLNWHPEDRFLLATGGRDTSIKIWNTQQLKTHPVNIIQTIAPVACVKWRPNYKNHIASCALILDNNVTIWDIGRPYVPFATFEEHTDVTTDFVWQKDPDVIISCSKDKLLYNHAIVNAKRPAEDANPVALGFAPNGTVGHALTDKTKRFVNMKSNSSIKSPPPIVSQPLEFKPEKSTLTLYSLSLETDLSKIPDESLIQNLAKEYKFHGKPIGELCQHNADVSIKYGLSEKALTWSILMQLFKNYDSSNPNIPLPSPMSQNSVMSFASEKNRKLETPEMMMGHRGSSVIEEENNSFSDEDILSIDTPNSLGQGRGDLGIGPDMSLAVFDDDEDDGYTNELFSRDPETEGDELDFLPHEGIQVREPLDSGKSLQQHQDSQAELQEVAEQQYRRQHFNGMPTLVIPDWEFKETVKEMLYFYAEKGDIQMSVTTMLVLQHKVRDLIPKDEQEDWYSGYLDILYQFQLFNIATEVINFAPEPINTLNHNMTTIHMQCQMCNKPIAIDKPGCYCKKCEKITQTCAVCQIPVKGLFVWCQGCGHGGHLIHMKEWYKLNTHCPTGCGHKCEYS